MKKLILLLKKFLVAIVLSKMVSCNLAPGSYPYVEEYAINVNELQVIEGIKNFKKDNPEYIVPEQTQLKDGRNSENDYWFHLYFYYKEENKIIYAWTRPAGKDKTTFALVGVNNGLTIGNWKEINKDFSKSENNEEKKKFEERILNKIKEKL